MRYVWRIALGDGHSRTTKAPELFLWLHYVYRGATSHQQFMLDERMLDERTRVKTAAFSLLA